MPTIIKYPKELTDPEWKKVEKTAKVSDTGVGRTLRNLEDMVKAANTELNGHRDLAKLDMLFKGVKSAAGGARSTLIQAIQDTQKKKNEAGAKVLQAYFSHLHDFDLKVVRLDAHDRFGLDENLKRAGLA